MNAISASEKLKWACAQSRTAIVRWPSVEKNNTPWWRLCGSRTQAETLLDIDRHYPDFRVRGSRARHGLPPAKGGRVAHHHISLLGLSEDKTVLYV